MVEYFPLFFEIRMSKRKKKRTPFQFLTDIVLAKIIVKIGPPPALDNFQILGWTVPVDCYCAHS